LGKVSSNNLSSTYNNDKIQSLRQEFLNGDKPASCSSCWEREEMIGTSRRIWFTDKFVEPGDEVTNYTPSLKEIKWYQADVNLSNICNLKCRMCGSWASNQWFEEELELSNKINNFVNKNDTLQPLNWVLPNRKEFVSWVNETFLKYRASGPSGKKEIVVSKKFTPFKYQKLLCLLFQYY
jgi:hypothetical protein